MARPKTITDYDGYRWGSDQIASLFEVIPKQVQNWAREAPGGCCIESQTAGGARKFLWDLKATIKWRLSLAGRRRGNKPTHDPDDPDAAMFSGDSSPALERWREIRAEREALKLSQDRAELVELKEIASKLAASGAAFRRRLEAVGRTFPQAVDAINQALDDTVNDLGLSEDE